MRLMVFLVVPVHAAVVIGLFLGAPALWRATTGGDVAAAALLVLAAGVALVGIRPTLAVLLAAGARVVGARLPRLGAGLWAAAIRTAPAFLRRSLVTTLGTGVVVLGIAGGAHASPAWPTTPEVPTPTLAEPREPLPVASPAWPVSSPVKADDQPVKADDQPVKADDQPGPVDDPAHAPEAPAPSTPHADNDTTAEEYVVEAGDSLWGIADALVADGAGEEGSTGSGETDATARAVARLHELNRAVIGADPDLLVPGQVLRVPAAATPGDAT
ncbi:LysM peptidoglycan-binding domain-containing protein [Brevibacterium litoralis]|uniref:LysM peptidoglycan-binding domain-containing protein n=1 Tax=Brevibacterium litoralis TaxID=3138935 RepID=UPI0032EF1328